MKRIVFASALLVSLSSTAGDGGFDLWTCVSDSGRTNLTILSDNFSGADVPMKIVFGIDGQFATYEHYREDIERPEDKVCEDDCTSVTFDTENKVIVRNGEFVALTVTLANPTSATTKATIAKGFLDPRPDRHGSTSGNALTVSCKRYYQGP